MAGSGNSGQAVKAEAEAPARLNVLRRLRARLAARADTEHEQALVRLAVGLVLGLYLLPEILVRRAAGVPEPHILVWMGFLAASAVLFAAIVVSPGASPSRRSIAAAIDAGTVTWCMVHFEAVAAPLVLIYLWSTIGMGFRFGPRQLLLSLAFSVTGFATVLAMSEFWRSQLTAGLGFMVGLIALSLYVRKLVRQMFEALSRAEAANEAKRRFISMVSHELRTPLNAIIGMADLLRDTSLNREQADMLQTLRSSSRVMLSLVEDVLDFSKIEAGKLVLDKTDFDLHALVNSTCRILAAQATEKGIEFVVSIMPEVPPAVRGDPHHLRQVLINLVSNAVKFTERGSVTVHVSAHAETEAKVDLKFSIRDTGIGIAAEAQARIFESFTQADQSTARRFGGTGLGTTIARQLVVLMGGKIGVQSAVGLGSTFWVELSLEKQPETAAASMGQLGGARVLLAGFPATEREPLEQTLASWGAVAVAAPTIEEGVGRLVAEISLAQPYHSALLYAPKEDLKLAQRFRRAAPDPAPPVILAVPRYPGVARFDALSSGFAAVLELPFDKRQLFNVLHSVSAGDEVHEGVVRMQDYMRHHPTARKLRVLVADDIPTNREVIGRILERAGHSVTLVNDGEQALEAIDRSRYDFVLLDRNMPRMGGLETLQALRLMSRGQARLPVIMLSADVTPEAKREAMDAGADAFLPKPVEALRLLDALQSLSAGAADETPPSEPSRAGATPASAPPEVVNIETLGQLESLGSSAGFVEKLADVFLADASALVGRMKKSLAGRNYHEFRSLLHAMKGSCASMGTDRLTRLCADIGRLSDPELRLQAPGLVRTLADELSAVRDALEHYLRDRQKSAKS